MGNTEDKKDVELKRIPRNPKIPMKDEEVNEILKQAAEQIAEMGNKVEKSSDLTEKTVENLKDTKPDKKETEEKKAEVKSDSIKETKTSEVKKKEDSDRENIDLNVQDNKKPDAKKNTVSKGSRKKSKNSKSKKLSEEASKEKSDKQVFDDRKLQDKKSETEQKEDIVKSFSTKKNDKKQLKAEKDFKVEDDIYVAEKASEDKRSSVKNYKMTKGEVVGSVFEGIWTGIKLVVLLTIITAVVGFFMSRDLLIRGRSGEQLSKQGMNVAGTTLATRLEEREDGKTWNETVKKEKLTLTADDGKILVAQKVVVNKKNNNWVVILHGQNGSVEDIYDIGFQYAAEGYNILMPDLRAHGESEGSFYGMGWLDRLDVINWIDVILEEYPSANVIIHGIDLGADTALMLSGEPLKDSVKVIIAEGAYTSAWDVVKTEYKTRHEQWPVFPILNMVNPVAKVWGGYSLKEADAVKQVKNAQVPILLIRGQNDTYVTEAMTEELNQAIASEHEVLTIATGTHEDCRFAEPDTYYNKVMEFIGKYVK